jgi:ribosomal protein L29
MKKNDFIALRKKEVAELIVLLDEKKALLSKAMASAKLGTEKNVKLPWQLRREIAKISTIIREKELTENMNAKKANAK